MRANLPNVRDLPRKRLVVVLLLAVCLFVAKWNATIEKPLLKKAPNSLITKQQDASAGEVLPELCKDPDSTPAPQSNKENNVQYICRCTDPTIPIPGNHVEEWMKFHRKLVKEANRNGSLDLVLLGDSLIEMWNGTSMFGKVAFPKIRLVFDSLFTRTGGGSLDAIALGTAADKAPNLLWHLQNGMLPDTLQPKVWMVLIGTNDLGFAHCSKQSTLKAILHTTTYLHEQRPKATILLHGLLPRGEGRGKAMILGRTWKDIQWINQQLEHACSLNPQWHYMDTGKLFLMADGTRLDSQLIADGVHPRLSGFRQWGPLIVKKVEQLLLDAD